MPECVHMYSEVLFLQNFVLLDWFSVSTLVIQFVLLRTESSCCVGRSLGSALWPNFPCPWTTMLVWHLFWSTPLIRRYYQTEHWYSSRCLTSVIVQEYLDISRWLRKLLVSLKKWHPFYFWLRFIFAICFETLPTRLFIRIYLYLSFQNLLDKRQCTYHNRMFHGKVWLDGV